MKNKLLIAVSAFLICGTINAQVAVRINCTGTGNGEVQRTYEYNGNRCGATDYYFDEFIASYDFLPDQTSELTHVYVNNVDRINDIYTHYSGTSGSVHTLWFSLNSASSITINPVFNRLVFMIVASSPDSTRGYVIGSNAYEAGAVATLTAVPYEGYIFSHWQDSITINPRRFTVVRDAIYRAYFVSSDGINEKPSKKYALYISPNPASNAINVSIKGFNGDVRLNVFDIEGHKVANQSFNCNGRSNARIDASGLPSGIYFVQTVAGDNISVQKIVVKK